MNETKMYFFTAFLIFPLLEYIYANDKYLITTLQPTSNMTGVMNTYNGDVLTINENNKSSDIVRNQMEISSIDADERNDFLYFYDSKARKMHKRNQGTRSESILQSGISSKASLAFDWITKNIYWSDGTFNWIAVHATPSVDRNMFTIILRNNIERINGITIDPLKGYIFWTDVYYGSARISRANLSGKSPNVIIYRHLDNPMGIVTDVMRERIYWADDQRNAIESSKYDGSDRRIIYRKLNAFFTEISVDENHACFTARRVKAVWCINKATSYFSLDLRYNQTPLAVYMYDINMKPTSTENKCLIKKCQHICVNDPLEAKCLCKEGYTLQNDDISCKNETNHYWKAIYLTNKSKICELDIRSLTSANYDLKCLSNIVSTGISFLAIDAEMNMLYYADSVVKQLKSYNLLTNRQKDVVHTGIVSGLSYNWLTKVLYWTESDTRSVKQVDVVSSSFSTMAVADEIPHHVTVDPHGKNIYWLAGKATSYIEVLSTQGFSTRKTLITGVSNSEGLHFDVDSRKLFMMHDGYVYSRGSEGIKSIKSTHSNVQNFLIYQDYAVWSSLINQFQTMEMRTNTGVTNINLNNFGRISAMAIYDKSLQQDKADSCLVENGGCEHICLPTSDKTHDCKCDFGFTIAANLKNCSSVPMKTDFWITADLNHNLLYQISNDGSRVVALDVSVTRPVDVAYDLRMKFLYWSDANNRRIQRVSMYGGFVETILTFVNEYPNNLDFDQSNGFLYYTTDAEDDKTPKTGKIGVIDTGNMKNKDLVTSTNVLRFIQGLYIYPNKNYMFWTTLPDGTSGGRIVRSSLTGQNNVVLISTYLNIPGGITVDTSADRLYWVQNEMVEYSDLSGNGRTILKKTKQGLNGIGILGSYIYITGFLYDKIVKLQKSNGAEKTWMKPTPEIGSMITLQYYSDDMVRCTKDIPKARLGTSCKNQPNEMCSTYTCENGYEAAHGSITCLSTGLWSKDTETWCQEKSGLSVQGYAIIGGIGFVVLVFIIVVVAICCRRTRRKQIREPRHSHFPTQNTNTAGQMPLNQFGYNPNAAAVQNTAIPNNYTRMGIQQNFPMPPPNYNQGTVVSPVWGGGHSISTEKLHQPQMSPIPSSNVTPHQAGGFRSSSGETGTLHQPVPMSNLSTSGPVQPRSPSPHVYETLQSVQHKPPPNTSKEQEAADASDDNGSYCEIIDSQINAAYTPPNE